MPILRKACLPTGTPTPRRSLAASGRNQTDNNDNNAGSKEEAEEGEGEEGEENLVEVWFEVLMSSLIECLNVCGMAPSQKNVH
jgi:hypothetical protein